MMNIFHVKFGSNAIQMINKIQHYLEWSTAEVALHAVLTDTLLSN